MMKMAASPDGEEAATDLPETCKRFYQKETEGLADKEFSLFFEKEGHGDVAYAHGSIQAYRNGNFEYAQLHMPSNFTAFAFYEQSPLARGNQSRQLTLHLLQNHAHNMTEDRIRSLAKQIITAPSDFAEVMIRLGFFEIAAKFFFSEDSELTYGLKCVQKKLKAARIILKGMMESRPTLAAEFLYAVDIRAQLWLSECRKADDRSEVNDRLVNFDDIVDDCVTQRFNVSLPGTFLMPADSNSDDEVQANESRDSRKKRRKRAEPAFDDSRHDKNEHQVEEFKMKQGEDWKNDFSGKCIEHRPSWGKKFMCPRWHTGGFCFKSCKNAESHVNDDKVPQDKRKEYRTFLKKCRQS